MRPWAQIRSLFFVELFLSGWAACALLYQTYAVLNPGLEFPMLSTSPLHTSVAEINVVVISILMWILQLRAIRRMSAALFELGVFKQFLWMVFKNALTLSPLFLLYDVWLIDFIYTTWTCKFALVFQTLQAFPAFTLLVHSIYQHCFISTVKRNVCARRRNANFGRVAVVSAVVNLVMLLYLVCAVVMISVTRPSELLDAFWLMTLELIFRVVGLVAFLHMYFQRHVRHFKTETELDNNPEATLVYTVPSFSLLTEEARREVFQIQNLSQSPPSLEKHEVVPEQVRGCNTEPSCLVILKPFLHAGSQLEHSVYVY